MCVNYIQMLTADEKKQAEVMQKANPDMIYLNDINAVVGGIISLWQRVIWHVVVSLNT